MDVFVITSNELISCQYDAIPVIIGKDETTLDNDEYIVEEILPVRLCPMGDVFVLWDINDPSTKYIGTDALFSTSIPSKVIEYVLTSITADSLD